MVFRLLIYSYFKFKYPSFILLLCVANVYSQEVATKSREESFVVTLNANDFINGVINLPADYKETKKIVILSPHPLQKDKDYDNFYRTISDSLSNYGIVSIRYDNNKIIRPENYTISLSTRYLKDVISFIRSDSRFKQFKIGVLGHSEAGYSSLLAASQNKLINFSVLLSTPLIDGRKQTMYGYKYQFNTKFSLQNPEVQQLYDLYCKSTDILFYRNTMNEMKKGIDSLL